MSLLKRRKPTASLSLDLDDLWAYMKTHGDPGWTERPTYLAAFLPDFLNLLDRHGLRITFFVVGKDAARNRNRELLSEVVLRGHEIANHSLSHEPLFGRYGPDRLSSEICEAAEAIHSATGEVPRGFRGPGFSWSARLLESLADEGYLYDASTFPTFIGPIARAHYLAGSDLSESEKAQLSDLYGSLSEGFRPVKPFKWRLSMGRELLEIPVTTIPILKLPFHMTYLGFLSGLAPSAARFYLEFALGLCRTTGTPPSFLLHPLDFLGSDDVPQLSYFPGMQTTSAKKTAATERVLQSFLSRFEVGTMESAAREALLGPTLPLRASRVARVGSGSRR